MLYIYIYRSRCIDCGGTGVCEHNRVRRNCKDCGGNNLCIPHKKPKSRCVECGGASTCEHKKLRRHCFECGGVAVCAHKRIRRDCKICKGRCVLGLFCLYSRFLLLCGASDETAREGVCSPLHAPFPRPSCIRVKRTHTLFHYSDTCTYVCDINVHIHVCT